jgi:hypothetical protein
MPTILSKFDRLDSIDAVGKPLLQIRQLVVQRNAISASHVPVDIDMVSLRIQADGPQATAGAYRGTKSSYALTEDDIIVLQGLRSTFSVDAQSNGQWSMILKIPFPYEHFGVDYSGGV